MRTKSEASPALENVLPSPPELTALAFEASSFAVRVSIKPHEAPLHLLAELVTQVVQSEGPIHRDLIARRVTEAFGKARTGKRIRETSDRALARATRSGRIVVDGQFSMTKAQQDNSPLRDRSAPDAAGTAGHPPPIEIWAAAPRVVAESREMPREELIVATARLLGFVRVEAELRGVIDGTLSRPA